MRQLYSLATYNVKQLSSLMLPTSTEYAYLMLWVNSINRFIYYSSVGVCEKQTKRKKYTTPKPSGKASLDLAK